MATRRSVEPGGEHLLEPTSSSLAIRGPCQPGCMLSGSETVPVPPRYARVDPWVISSGTEADIAFLQTAFDAQETLGSRMLGPDCRIGHIEVELGESVIMLFDAQQSGVLHLRICGSTSPTPGDVRSRCGSRRSASHASDRARLRGACGTGTRSTGPPLVDTPVEDVAVAELGRRFADPSAQQALAYVQQSLARELERAR